MAKGRMTIFFIFHYHERRGINRPIDSGVHLYIQTVLNSKLLNPNTELRGFSIPIMGISNPHLGWRLKG